MAQTFTLYSKDIAFAATKVMAGIKNLHATEQIKIRRVGLLNAQTTGVTGVVCSLEFRKDTNPTWTSPVTTGATIATHDSTNSAPTSYAYGSAGTYTAAAALTLRRTIWSSDEAAASSATSYSQIIFHQHQLLRQVLLQDLHWRRLRHQLYLLKRLQLEQ